jgi:Mg2+-importing ATPase
MATSAPTPELDKIFKDLKTSRTGLTQAEAARRLREYGLNEFAGRKKLQPLFIFFSKFRNPLLILLIVAALVSGFLGSHFEAGVILVIVFGSAFIDFFNTYKSAKAAEELQDKVNITAAIWRNGKLEERNMREVVPGDVFSLEAGDLVPADGVLIEAKDLFLNESVLTGESMPLEKEVSENVKGGKDDSRQIFLGTSVVSGKALAVAVVTGLKTKVGSIADKLKRPDTPTEFEKNLKDFSYFIFKTTIFLVLAVIFIDYFIFHRDFFQIFLFAVAIAVGLTPELLPLIVTSNLAKGALKMSENGVIVKKLAAIHNFGSVDVLCTDKTGTLTEDRIVLTKCVDAAGKDDGATFFWGYLSSKNLTGIHGILDKAIEDFKKLDVHGWEKVDEVPFDAERRLESVVVTKTDAGKFHPKGETMLIAKGAPEEILKISKETVAARKKINAEYERLSSDGFRVLGLGIKKVTHKTTPYGKADEKDLEFVGFLAFLDPPKKSVKRTLERMEKVNVAMKIITGDNFLVTKHIAGEIGLAIIDPLTGDEIAAMHDSEFKKRIEKTNVFTRVNPEQKEMIIRTLRANGHVVAYMGDGVNDVLSIKEADVGISVQNAVDIAKETADIILLRKGLGEIVEGIIEGRRTFANTFKYLMMALSSNFGNMFSMPIASIFLPFLPMTAPQILLNNFLYDSSQLAIPFDNVDEDFLSRPKKFDIGFMKKFMFIFGPLSSCFDFITFAILLWVLHVTGTGFQTGWFLESIATQTFVVLIIRSRSSVLGAGAQGSKPSKWLVFSTVGAVVIGWLITYSFIGPPLGFVHFGLAGIIFILCIVAVYLAVVEFAKKFFYQKYGSLIEK